MNEKRLVFTDALRIVSLLFVVIIHVTSVGIREHVSGSYAWTANIILNSISRWAVPMFFMISGFFFLDAKKELHVKDFYRKNVAKIIITIIIASLFYSIIDQYLYGKLSFKSIPLALYAIVSNKSGYHLWFLYVLLMLYIATPVLRVITENAEKKLMRYALVCWIIFTIIVGQINAVVDEYYQFKHFLPYESLILTKFSGYYLLGFYLKKYPIVNQKQKCILFILAAVSLFLMAGLTVLASKQTETASYFKAFQMPLGLGNLSVCIAVFVFVSDLEERMNNEIINKMIYNGGKLTFYAYLLHVAVIDVFRNAILKFGMNSLMILLFSSIVIIFSYALAYVFHNIVTLTVQKLKMK